MVRPDRPLARFAIIAAVVAAVDLVSKLLAVALLGGRGVRLTSFARLVLVFNDQSALSFSLGAHTRLINAAATLAGLALAVLICRALADLDRRAPVALGLVAGAAAGNLAGLLVSAAGVPDFIALAAGKGEVVMNLADVAAYLGIALGARTVGRLVAEIARTRRPVAHPAPTPMLFADRQRFAGSELVIAPLADAPPVERELPDAPAAPRPTRTPNHMPEQVQRLP